MSIYPKLVASSNNEIYKIILGNDENRFTHSYLKQFIELLDIVEKHNGPTSLILCSHNEKFFSNGLCFKALEMDILGLLQLFHTVLYRLLSASIPTIAVINGHAYAGGAMVALSCDYRVMHSVKGYFCINEINIGFPLTSGLISIITAKINRAYWTSLILQGKQFSGKDAFDAHIVSYIGYPDDLMTKAMEIATNEAIKGNNKTLFKLMKEELFSTEIKELQNCSFESIQTITKTLGLLKRCRLFREND